jgi:dihydrofolate reductase
MSSRGRIRPKEDNAMREAEMGKLVVTEFITLDGVIEDPGGAESFERGGWAFKFDQGEEGGAFKFEELRSADAQLLGRRTYEGFAKAWPTMEGTGEFGEKMNAMPKFVVSTTLDSAEWNNTTLLRGDLATEVSALKERFAGDILVAGSAQLVQGLLAAELVDELHLMVFPIVVGGGKRLFSDAADTRSLTLSSTRQVGEVVLSTFARS